MRIATSEESEDEGHDLGYRERVVPIGFAESIGQELQCRIGGLLDGGVWRCAQLPERKESS
jgi:hypothetical protein